MQTSLTYSQYSMLLTCVAKNKQVEVAGLFDSFRWLKTIREVIDTVKTATGIGTEQLVKAFRQRKVFAVLKAIRFNFALLLKGLQKALGLVRQGLLKTIHLLVKTNAFQRLRQGALKVDQLLKEHPILNRCVGIALAGLLFWMWLNISFTGDASDDFDMTWIALALKGQFAISDLVATEAGLAYVILFFTGFASKGIVSFPWLGSSLAHVLIAIAWTGFKFLRDSATARSLQLMIQRKLKVESMKKEVALRTTFEKRLTAGTAGIQFGDQDGSSWAASIAVEAITNVKTSFSDYEYEFFADFLANPKKFPAAGVEKLKKKVDSLLKPLSKLLGLVEELEAAKKEHDKAALALKQLKRTAPEKEYLKIEDRRDNAAGLIGDLGQKIEDTLGSNAWNPWPVDLMTASLLAVPLKHRKSEISKLLDSWIYFETEVNETKRSFLNAFNEAVADFKAGVVNLNALGLVAYASDFKELVKDIKAVMAGNISSSDPVLLFYIKNQIGPMDVDFESLKATRKSAIKGGEAYMWGTYVGKTLTLTSKKGTVQSLSKGKVFGVRLSGDGKKLRFVFEDLGLTKVFTVDPNLAKKIYKNAKKF